MKACASMLLLLASSALVGCSGDEAGELCPRGQARAGDSCQWYELDGFDTEDVTFAGASGLLLEGDITIPTASNASVFPAVLLLHDRGAQNRHGSARGQHEVDFGKTIPIFDDLRDHLAARGFVVLRYDNRLCFSTNGCDNDYPSPFSGVTYRDILNDARAAAAYLAGHSSVIAQDITIIGNGDGAQLATALTTPVRDVVAFGGSYEPVDDNLATQLETTRALLESQGLSNSQIDAQTTAQQQLLADLDDIRKGTFKGDTIGGLSATFWEQWLDLGDSATLRMPQATYGVLQMHGTYDSSVLDATATAFSKTMENHPDTTYKLFPQRTHPMVRVSEPDLDQVTPNDVASSLDGLVLGELANWLFRGTDGQGPAASRAD